MIFFTAIDNEDVTNITEIKLEWSYFVEILKSPCMTHGMLW